MERTAELAERLDVRLHTHLAESAGGRRVRPRPLRLPPGGALRADGLGSRPNVGRPLRHAFRGRGPPARGGRRRRGPLPELQPDPRLGGRTGRRPSRRRGAGRARRRRLVVGGLRLAVAGGPPGHAPGQAAGRAGGRDRQDGAGDGDARWRGVPRPPRRAGRSRWRPARSPTWSCGRSTGRPSPVPSPTRSRPGLAADRWRPPHHRGRRAGRARRCRRPPGSGRAAGSSSAGSAPASSSPAEPRADYRPRREGDPDGRGGVRRHGAAHLCRPPLGDARPRCGPPSQPPPAGGRAPGGQRPLSGGLRQRGGRRPRASASTWTAWAGWSRWPSG